MEGAKALFDAFVVCGRQDADSKFIGRRSLSRRIFLLRAVRELDTVGAGDGYMTLGWVGAYGRAGSQQLFAFQ